ncbi:hypothetical protein [Stenotrophomonas hibiscicola]|uniref:hypothetical protein n=1 Tax=Stenotrophomonas hibiscicola TaxID=86189 RepID=UPI0003685CB5|nr:hypothetical protein [[Pseudomonas] hibiscicola]
MNLEQIDTSTTAGKARVLLAMALDERGYPYEAENVRDGSDLESYEGELQAIGCLIDLGLISSISDLAGEKG